MPAKRQPSLTSRASGVVRVGGKEGGEGRTVCQEWTNVSEAEMEQQRRAQDERLKEERRLKQMQDKIALLKARMGLRDARASASSSSPPAAVTASAFSRTRLPPTFSASPYASLSANRSHPLTSPSRPRPSSGMFLSPRRRPHPFLRHSPLRRRRLSLSPNKQRWRSDEQQPRQQRQQQQQQQLPHQQLMYNQDMSAEESASRQQLQQRHQQHSRVPLSLNNTKKAESPTRHSSQPMLQSVNQQHSRRGSDIVSSPAHLSAYVQSLVESEVARHMSELELSSSHALMHRPAPPSPPLVHLRPMAAGPPLLHRYTAASVVAHMDELEAAVLDRVVEDTVAELNAAEERQRASVVLDEVDDMVSELERMEESVTQRWLGGNIASPRQQRTETEAVKQPDVHASATTAAAYVPAVLPHHTASHIGRSVSSGLKSSPSPVAAASLSTDSPTLHVLFAATSARSASFHARVLPLCADVSPQLADPTGVTMCERWCDELVDDAVSAVVEEMWQCMDAMVDRLVEHEVS